MKLTKPFLSLLLFCALCGIASAQTSTVRGFVYDKQNGEPVIFTTVYLLGTNHGTSTDINGFFSIVKVPSGDYTLAVSSVEYDTINIPITVGNDKIVKQNIYLSKRTVKIGQVDISAKKEENKTDVKISTIQFTAKEISVIPTIGGEADLAQYLQIIPGVISTGDQGGQIYIRGGSPIQTKVLLDGITIYNPFHSIGLFSVFETDIIKSVDVLTGGFNAEYGGRISAIIDIKTRDGNKKNISGKISASPFLAKALLEGPITRRKSKRKNPDANSKVSFLLTTKHSYLDKTSKTLYSYAGDDGIPFSFADYYGKLAFNAPNGSKLNLFGFHFNDKATVQGVSEFEWKSLGVGTNFVVVPGNSSTLINGMFAYSNYNMVLREADGQPRNSSVSGFNIGMDFTYFVKKGELKYGFNINGFKTVFEFYNSLGLKIDQNQNTTELGFFIRYKKVFGRFVFEPSVRFDYYASLAAISPEPRLGMKYNISDDVRIKVAGGMYSQNLISGKSDRDVVNLFTSFLSGPDGKLDKPDGGEARNNLQTAYHAVAGVEYDVTHFMEVNLEGYYKRFGRLITINRNKLFPEDPDYEIETGDAYGMDFLLKFDYRKMLVWASYSLAWVTRYNGDQTYYPHYDRRHNLNIVASYEFGKKPVWEASARWNFGSGFPFTRTQGFYQDMGTNFIQDGIRTDYVTANNTNQEDIGILYEDDLDGGRLPFYHRLDLALQCTFKFKHNLALDITASVSNIYNRDNIFYFDRIRYERVNQLPILPSLGVAFSF